MYIELQLGHAPHSWTSKTVYHGDLMLLAGSNLPFDVRWQCLTEVPTYSFLLHVSQVLFTGLAQVTTGCDRPHLTVPERIGFHDPLLTQVTLALWRELYDNAPSGRLFAQCATQMLVLHLIRYYTSTKDVSATSVARANQLTKKQLEQVISFIQTHAHQDLALEALAQQANLSLYHFTRLFRQTTGLTPHHFVLHQRIERARHLIAETMLPLGQIALDSGFTTQSHFTRVFKHFVGMTPHACRQESCR